MSNPLINGIGPDVKVAIGVAPLNHAAGAVIGSAIDRLGFNSMVLVTQVGTVTGTPDSFSVPSKVTHCATEGGTYADYQPGGVAAAGATTAVTAINTQARKSIDLSQAERYIKIVTTPALVNGTSPKVNACAVVILGGAVESPAQADD